MKPHSKGYKTFDEQLGIIEGRGMPIVDSEKCRRALEQYGYYRLSAYWYPFRHREPDHEEGKTTPGEDVIAVSSFDAVVDCYEFDREIRWMLLPWVERVEVPIRVAVAYEMGKLDRFGFFHPAYLSEDAWNKPYRDSDLSAFQSFRDRMEAKLAVSNEPIAKHHREQYNGAIPVWAAIEMWDFGTLESVLNMLMPDMRDQLGKQFGAPGWNSFKGWVSGYRQMRNICAHHGRFNRHHFANPPSFSKAHGERRFLHLRGMPERQRYRLYSHLVALNTTLDSLGLREEFVIDVLQTFTKLSELTLVANEDFGFVDNWQTEQIWTVDTEK